MKIILFLCCLKNLEVTSKIIKNLRTNFSQLNQSTRQIYKVANALLEKCELKGHILQSQFSFPVLALIKQGNPTYNSQTCVYAIGIQRAWYFRI